MDLNTFLYVAAVILIVAAVIIFAWSYRAVRKEILDALTEAESEEEKLEIERKVVKALFPPRFNR